MAGNRKCMTIDQQQLRLIDQQQLRLKEGKVTFYLFLVVPRLEEMKVELDRSKQLLCAGFLVNVKTWLVSR